MNLKDRLYFYKKANEKGLKKNFKKKTDVLLVQNINIFSLF